MLFFAFFALLILSASACTNYEAGFIDRFLLTKATVAKMNRLLIGERMPRTIGDCDGIDDLLKPCVNRSFFPIQKKGRGYTVSLDYATGMDSLKLTNASMRCDAVPRVNETASSKELFLEMDGSFAKIGLGTHIDIAFPRITKTYPCIFDAPNSTSMPDCSVSGNNLGLRAAGRIGCKKNVTDPALQFQVDPTFGLNFTGDVMLHIKHLPALNLKTDIFNILAERLHDFTIPCPGPLRALCKRLCPADFQDDQMPIVI